MNQGLRKLFNQENSIVIYDFWNNGKILFSRFSGFLKLFQNILDQLTFRLDFLVVQKQRNDFFGLEGVGLEVPTADNHSLDLQMKKKKHNFWSFSFLFDVAQFFCPVNIDLVVKIGQLTSLFSRALCKILSSMVPLQINR